MSLPYTLVEKSVLRKPNSTKTIGTVLTDTIAWMNSLEEGNSVVNFFYYAEVIDSDTKDRYFVYSDEAVAYFGLADNIVVADTASANGKSYSLDEQLTNGTWIDGKPIYRKTIDLPDISVSQDSTTVATIPNLGILIKSDIIFNPGIDSTAGHVDLIRSPMINSIDTHDIVGDGSAVATYQLNGDATDLGGNFNGVATDVTYGVGKFGQAGVFNGSSSNISINTGTYSSRTTSMWVSPKDVSDSGHFVGETNKEATNSENDYCNSLKIYNNKLELYYYNGSAHTVSGTTDISQNNFIFVIMMITSSSIKVYLNGNLEISIDSSNIRNSSFLHLGYGKENSGNNFFNGLIDQVRIFNRTLTQEEVTTLYNEKIKDSKNTETLTLKSDLPNGSAGGYGVIEYTKTSDS